MDTPTFDELFQELESIANQTEKDFMTSEEIAASLNCTPGRARDMLKMGLKNGVVVLGRVKRMTMAGTMTTVPAYKIAQSLKGKKK